MMPNGNRQDCFRMSPAQELILCRIRDGAPWIFAQIDLRSDARFPGVWK
jgi:hypothetical protein